MEFQQQLLNHWLVNVSFYLTEVFMLSFSYDVLTLMLKTSKVISDFKKKNLK